jgi:uncharacterized protein involved in exopolysaccharide biosynthesis
MKPLSVNSELEVVSAPPDIKQQRDHANEQIIARLRLLWTHRWFLSRAAVWGLLAGTLIAFLIPVQYESTARLMPPDDQSGTGMALFSALAGKSGSGLGAMAGDLLGAKNSGDLFVGVLKSRTVQDDIVKKFDLRKVYRIKGWEDARRELASNSSISQDRKSGIIAITVTDHDPHRSAALAQEYLEALNMVVNQVSTSSARRERIFLEGRLQEVREDLEGAEKDFSEYASKTGAIDVKEQAKAMVTAAATLQGELIAAQSQLEGLKQIYTDNNVRVRSLKARVSELKVQLEKVGGKQEIANDAATNLKDDALYPSIRKLPLLGVTYADLYRRTKVQETVFETLTQEYELAKVREAKEIPSVKILDPANVPEKKSFPPRLVITFMGMLFSFIAGGAWLFGKTRWQETDPLNPGKRFAMEVLQAAHSSMPWAEPNGSRFQAATHKLWTRYIGRNGSSAEPKSAVSTNDSDSL